MKTYTLPLSDPQANIKTVGGKGMSLAKLSNAGMPVPDGFHVTTEAYRQFVKANDLQTRINATLEGVEMANPAALESASKKISRLFAEASIHRKRIRDLTRRESSGGGAIVRYRRRLAGGILRRPTGDLPEYYKCRSGAQCHPEMLGIAVDGARHRLSRPPENSN
jgi:hypothetical protein